MSITACIPPALINTSDPAAESPTATAWEEKQEAEDRRGAFSIFKAQLFWGEQLMLSTLLLVYQVF